MNFLLHEVLPSNHLDAKKIKRKSERFFVQEFQMFRRGFNQAPLKCLVGVEVASVLKEFHVGECGEHKWAFRIFKQFTNLGYCWPTMKVVVVVFT